MRFYSSTPSQLTNVDFFSLPTPTAGTPKASSPPLSPQLAPQGPSQLLTALLTRLPDATNRALIDQAAIDFAFLNSKASRKRLVRVCHHTSAVRYLLSSLPVFGSSAKEPNRFAASLLEICGYLEQVHARRRQRSYRHSKSNRFINAQR